MRKKIDKYYIYIILIALFFVFVVTPSSFLFGSTIDWVSQHIAFPDYFRKLFYETGNLFPNFAFSIGGGQNIFHFSYYGLFNPFVIFSSSEGNMTPLRFIFFLLFFFING